MNNQVSLKEDLKAFINQFSTIDSGIISLSQLPDNQQENAKKILPTVQSIISIAVNYNQSAVKSQFQPVANMEFRNAYKKRDSVCVDIVNALMEHDVEAVAVTETFALDNELTTPWLLSHKDIAVKAGIGVMGLNRIILHEKYGASIVLGSILIDKKLETYDSPSIYNPCINCNLCKTVCPTASISKGGFDFMGCYTHNYRNRGNSFNDVLAIIENGNHGLEKITYEEKNKLWASIQEGYGYSCNQCIAVCPAAKKERLKYEANRKEYYQTYVKPFIDKEETVYVLKGSRSAEHVEKNPVKHMKYVTNGMSIDSIKAFKSGLRIAFDGEKAKGLNRTYKFIFTGAEVESFIVKIENGELRVKNEVDTKSDVCVKVDSKLWLKFLQNKKVLLKGLVTGKAKITGNPKLLLEFGRIFAA